MEPILQELRQFEPLLVLISLGMFLILFIWNMVLHMNIRKIQQKSAEFFAGNDVKNIEDIIVGHSRTLKALDKDIQELYNISNQINNLAHRGLHKFAMVRFNPFKDVGGDQSFSVAMLNGKNNGIVISSLYTREGARIYSKAIQAGESEKYPLTDEEKEAIKLAKTSETKKIN